MEIAVCVALLRGVCSFKDLTLDLLLILRFNNFDSGNHSTTEQSSYFVNLHISLPYGQFHRILFISLSLPNDILCLLCVVVLHGVSSYNSVNHITAFAPAMHQHQYSRSCLLYFYTHC